MMEQVANKGDGNYEYIDKVLQSFLPSEVIVQRQQRGKFIERFGDKFYLTVLSVGKTCK